MSNTNGNSYIGLLPIQSHDLEVSKGNIPGATAVFKFGYNPDVNGTEETIWNNGGDYDWEALTAATRMYFSSTSANDSIADIGARQVVIQGLDANYVEITETVDLTGQTQAATTQEFLRVNRAYVLTAGSSGTSIGTIYGSSEVGVAAGVPTGNIVINMGLLNQSQLGIYTVPAGRTFYLDDLNFTAGISQASKTATVRAVVREFGGVFRTRYINVVQSNQLIAKFEYPLAIPEKSDIELRVVTNSSNNQIGGSFQGVLIEE